MAGPIKLDSYLAGRWIAGSGGARQLFNPSTGQAIAEAAAGGSDFAGALSHARERGGPALRAMTFAERGALLTKLAGALHEHREELLDLETQNGGNTRGDGKFDLDGGTGTLAYYGKLAAGLGDAPMLVDGSLDKLSGSPRWMGQHVWAPRTGAAILINAFNFPIWGFCEKAAQALLAGMPVVAKPATSTALVAHRMAQIIVDSKLLPEGAFSFIAGGVGDLLDHLGHQDVVSFTGSSATARAIRTHDNLVANNVPVGVEADSLNSAILGADVDQSGETYDFFLRDVVREMTQKAGQKCTAVRRILVPAVACDDVIADLREQLAAITVGDPSLGREVKMGPLASADQLRDVRAGLDQLTGCAEMVHGDGGRGVLLGVDGDAGYFLSPVLLRAGAELAANAPVHTVEVFGPVATVIAYDGSAAAAAEIANRGQGALVSSCYTEDYEFATELATRLCPGHGRLFFSNAKTAPTIGPGAVLPQLMHGGPGRAGGGEELGGLRGLGLYMQRTAIQGYGPWLEKMLGLGRK